MCDYCRKVPHDPRCPEALDPRAVFICSDCGQMILEGDTFYRVMEETYCEECMEACREIAEVV